MNDQETKESWVQGFVAELEGTMKELGLERARKFQFSKMIDECERRYLISIRHPKYSSDPHKLYINPCVQIVHKSLQRACEFVFRDPRYRRFATLGGSLGLYKTEVGNSEEWPVDGPASGDALVQQLIMDVKTVAVPFWEHLDSLSKILCSVERNDIWSQRTDSWRFQHVVLLYLERGIDEALQFVVENKKRFRDIHVNELRERLCAHREGRT